MPLLSRAAHLHSSQASAVPACGLSSPRRLPPAHPPVCPAPAALLLPLPQKSNNVLLTASGTAKLADCAFSRDLKNTFLSELPLVGTFAW